MSPAPDLEARPALASGVRLQLDAVTGQRVLLYPEGIVELNETAGEIVVRCDGVLTVRGVLEQLAAAYSVEPQTLAADVLACLAGLVGRRLLELRA